MDELNFEIIASHRPSLAALAGHGSNKEVQLLP